MQVTAAQIRKARNAKYTVWDGEMIVYVMQNVGAHGFYSSVIIVVRMDAPLQTFTYDGYIKGRDKQDMMVWIAEKLTELSSGTMFNEGGSSGIEGLLKV